jgi:tetratricopeptide (TPR) repeat protein
MLALSALFWLTCRQRDGARSAAGLGLAAGLALANHHTTLLSAPASGWEFVRARRLPRLAPDLIWAAAFAACGILLYLFLPLRSHQGPPLDWGHPVDWPRFLWVFLRKDYGSFSLTAEGAAAWSWASAWGQIARYSRVTSEGLGVSCIGLAALGLAAGMARPSRFGLFCWIFFTGPFFLLLGNPAFDSQTSAALERFYLASWLGLAAAASAGLDWISKRLKPAAWALALLPLAAAWSSREAWWLRRDFAAYDYGRNILKSLPPGAVLFMDGGDDTFYATAFLTFSQGFRPDVRLYDRGGLVFKSAYGPDFRSLPRAEKEQRRRQVESKAAANGNLFYSTLNEEILPGARLLPWGLLRRPGLTWDLWPFYAFRWDERLRQAHYRDRALLCVYPVMRAASVSGNASAEALRWLRSAWDAGPDVTWLGPQVSLASEWLGFAAANRGDLNLAREAFVFAGQTWGGRASPFISLGAIYERLDDWPRAEAAYRQAIGNDAAAGKAYYNLGALYWRQARWSDAAGAFSTSARLDPADASAALYADRALRRASK